MKDKEIKKVFKKAKFKSLLVRIPCADKNSKKFYLKISRMDKTHINCKNKKSWISLFKSFGYKSFLKLKENFQLIEYNLYELPGIIDNNMIDKINTGKNT